MLSYLVILLLAVVFFLPVILACLYYLFLAVVAHWPRPRVTERPRPPRTRFAILIPAHNEESQIGAVLEACADLDYPPDRYQVFVIADNCTDRTAVIAAATGAHCLERHDPQRRGKGQALAWALDKVLAQRPDAVIVLDADCRLDRHALKTFDAHLQAGHPVLQASYVASNPDQSIVSYVAGVANLIENDLFYAPKSRLSLAVLLRGTGMVLHRDVLERCPWHAESIVEDVEYAIRLYEMGIPVKFVGDVRVWSAFPAQPEQMRVQRTRWIGGNFRLVLKHSFPLALRGLITGRPILIDLGWTLFVSVRTLFTVNLLLAVLFGCAVLLEAPEWLAGGLSGLCLALLGCCGLYFGLGVARLGLTAHRLCLLIQSPCTVARLLGTATASIWPGRVGSWERTPR